MKKRIDWIVKSSSYREYKRKCNSYLVNKRKSLRPNNRLMSNIVFERY